MKLYLLVISILLPAILPQCGFAAEVKESPVGLVLSPGGAKLLRANTETLLDARAGDLLFTGDGLRTSGGAASFLFCPSKTTQTLGATSEARFDAKQVKLKTGQITGEKPAQSCFLPQLVRVAVASQQHYGVSMTRGVDKPDALPTPRDKMPPQVVQALAPIDQALTADPKDVAAMIAAAALYENNNLPVNALVQYQAIREALADAIWVQGKIFELQQTVADAQQVATSPTPGGETYALLVGVSKFKDKELALQFAERDATSFDQLLLSPRGGGLPRDHVLLLTDENATTAAVRNGFQDFLKHRATKGDTVIIMIASHGTVEVPGSKNAFILTYDSDPQDLNSTALPMGELQALFEEQLSKVGRVILFVDVCKSGTIGSIKNANINSEVQHLGEVEGDMFGLMASRPRELSLEGPQFGGGHGLFSYYVLKGLSGDADANKDGKVDASELVKYVGDQVAAGSNNKQHPREFGVYDNALKLSDTTKPGIEVTGWPVLYDSRSGEPLYLAADEPVLTPQAARAAEEFEAALKAGRIYPDLQDSAFAGLDRLRPLLTAEQYQRRTNQLRVKLEDQAQNVLLTYLTGDQIPQVRNDFAGGTRATQAALRLTPESLYLEGRDDFFRGRVLLFDKKYPEALSYLESAVRIDPGTGYAYNALGIAYLEQARYDEAVNAFRDASNRAQHWAYPLHNLALAYYQKGDYQAAIATYERAIRMAPQYAYLPYNLGLIYQRINRSKDAESMYRKALALRQDAQTYNALGYLKFFQKKPGEAEEFYKTALTTDSSLLIARHNYAVLLDTLPKRREEGWQMWRGILQQDPNYTLSRLALAKALEREGRNADAAVEFRILVQQKPEYTAARAALGELENKLGNRTAALEQLTEAARLEPESASVYEAMGDVRTAEGNRAEAVDAYNKALQYAADGAAKKRIRKKLQQ